MISTDPVAVRARVARESDVLVPVWPLDSFIATNPLGGFESTEFVELVEQPPLPGIRVVRCHADYLAEHEAGRIPESALRAALAEAVPELTALASSPEDSERVAELAFRALRLPLPDPSAADRSERGPGSPASDLASEWLARLVARGNAEQLALYARFHAGASRDLSIPSAVRRRLAALPSDAEALIDRCAPAEGADPDAPIRSALLALPGWAAYCARATESDPHVSLTDLVAVVLAAHHAFRVPLPEARPTPSPWPDAATEASALAAAPGEVAVSVPEALRVLAVLPPAVRLLVWQTAAEAAHRATVRAVLEHPLPAPDTVEAQAVFCIDTRSEGIRRHLEALAPVETFGFAGFFAVPLEYAPLTSAAPRDQYPALLRAGVPASERTDPDRLVRFRARRAVAEAARHLRHAASDVPVASFAWAETMGWVDGARALARTIAPARRPEPELPTVIDVCERLSVTEQADVAEAVIRVLGITHWAPLVVFVGHTATTTNNLYRAALDCGACGGNSGAPNARAIAAILGNPPVRAELAARGITIPADTWIAAGLHDTTLDRVELLDAHLVPESHQVSAEQFLMRCTEAGEHVTRERARDLPEASADRPRSVRRRALDWAELFPELGLAGNASLLIAPRSSSRGADLHRRTFLHSYEPTLDTDGSALEAIMTGPLVVAQWINHQYYFSALNPSVHGAGNKTLHNAIGSFGVWTGYAGDLRVGLPWQSVAAGDELFHTPLRLSVFIEAPLERIIRIVGAHDTVRDLLDNEWISLHARPSERDAWRRYTRYGFAAASASRATEPSDPRP